MTRGAAKSADLRRIAPRDEPMLFGSLYRENPWSEPPPPPPWPTGAVLCDVCWGLTDKYPNCACCNGLGFHLPKDSTPISPAQSGAALTRWARFLRWIGR